MTTLRRDRATLTPRARSLAVPWVIATVLTASLALAFAGKYECRWQEPGRWWATAWCYSDVVDLWDERGFDVEAVPYGPLPVVYDGVPEGQPPRLYDPRYTFEYPPVLGFATYGISKVTDTERGFHAVNAATLAVAGVLTVWLLDRILLEVAASRERWLDTRVRLFGVVASPTLMTLAFQNWDLWSIAPATAGLYAAVRRRPLLAAAWFGFAAGVKWWPALLVVPLLAGPWAIEDRGWLRRLAPAGVFGAVWGAVQVPALLVSVEGWWESIAFHLTREPNRASLIGVISNIGRAVSDSPFWSGPYASITTFTTFAALVVVVAVVLFRLHVRRLDPAVASFVLVAVFLVVSKVVSVQFVLWLLPIAVIAGIRWWPVLVIDVLNAAVWLLWAPSGDDGSPLFWASLGVAAVRTLFLAAVAMKHLTRDPSSREARRLEPVGAA
ncbi:MAG: DUF2029 domain-containing protein [Actinobacteria bacterium]|nr:DUF2029 domain-containing protein [Actinomycetota bacterium]